MRKQDGLDVKYLNSQSAHGHVYSLLCDEIDALRDKIDVLLTVLDKDGDVWIDVDPIDHKKPKVLDADNGVSVKVRQLVGFRLDELIEASHHAGWIRAQMHAHKGD